MALRSCYVSSWAPRPPRCPHDGSARLPSGGGRRFFMAENLACLFVCPIVCRTLALTQPWPLVSRNCWVVGWQRRVLSGGFCSTFAFRSPSAGPRLLQGFERDIFKIFLHPLRSLINVGDDQPECLSEIDPDGAAYSKVRPTEVKIVATMPPHWPCRNRLRSVRSMNSRQPCMTWLAEALLDSAHARCWHASPSDARSPRLPGAPMASCSHLEPKIVPQALSISPELERSAPEFHDRTLWRVGTSDACSAFPIGKVHQNINDIPREQQRAHTSPCTSQ